MSDTRALLITLGIVVAASLSIYVGYLFGFLGGTPAVS